MEIWASIFLLPRLDAHFTELFPAVTNITLQSGHAEQDEV